MGPLIQRLASKISVVDSGCWLWLGCLNKCGYGSVSTGKHAKNALAHRFVYSSLIGNIPDGLELDHLCKIRNCVNPAHLEPVTHKTNITRALATSNTCRKGHVYTSTSVYVWNGQKQCKICRKQRDRKKYND